MFFCKSAVAKALLDTIPAFGTWSKPTVIALVFISHLRMGDVLDPCSIAIFSTSALLTIDLLTPFLRETGVVRMGPANVMALPH